MTSMRTCGVALLLFGIAAAGPATAAPAVTVGTAPGHTLATTTGLPPAQTDAIDDAMRGWLLSTGAPSVSIAVVANNRLAYAHAYGNARLQPALPATTGTRYAVDSVSKAFTATAVLMLQQDGKLKLDDPVSRYLPGLAGGDTVSIRQVLNHSAGFRDYWPQDFVPPEMSRPITLTALLDEWAKKPLDFAPGTDWQYSNTGFVAAGAIVEKLSGQPLLSFLRQRVFGPLHMNRITEDDTAPLLSPDAGAYTRYGLGPVRPATKEGAGWLFAASALAMAPSELARWDISLLDRSLLQPASYDALFASEKLKNGRDTRYGLGEEIDVEQGRLRISHGGAGSGFLAANALWPQQRIALVALTNNDWASPDGALDRIAFLVLPPTAAEARARAVFDGFRKGTVDRTLFTANGNSFLTPSVLADQKQGLAALGPVRLFRLDRESLRGGMRTRIWSVITDARTVRVVERAYPDGLIEQFMIGLP